LQSILPWPSKIEASTSQTTIHSSSRRL
jgi:hypothetical protein